MPGRTRGTGSASGWGSGRTRTGASDGPGRRSAGLAVLAVVTAAVFARPAGGKKVALLIGVNSYHHARLNQPVPLKFAEADVADLKKELAAAGYEVVTLTGKDATRKAIRDKLGELRKVPGDGGVFLVAFAGHGLQPEASATCGPAPPPPGCCWSTPAGTTRPAAAGGGSGPG